MIRRSGQSSHPFALLCVLSEMLSDPIRQTLTNLDFLKAKTEQHPVEVGYRTFGRILG